MSLNPGAGSKYAANIFIIDDEPVAAKVIELFLNQAGFDNLHVFTSSVEAMEILSVVQADLILTDVNMPELGGKFLTKLVRNSPVLKETPVIVITSDGTEQTRNHLLGNGVFNILSKPVKERELIGAVDKAIEMRIRMINKDVETAEEKQDVRNLSRLVEREKSLRSAFNRD